LGVRETGARGRFDGYTETYLVDNLPDGPDSFDELHRLCAGLVRFMD
jgi:hypothetical protein